MQSEISNGIMPTEVSHIDNNGSTKQPKFNIQIKNVDMSEDKQQKAIDIASQSLAQNLTPREIAGAVKKEFDRLYGPSWHCIVGKAYGSYVTHGTFY